MNIENFRAEGHKIIDWIADYYENLENRQVKSQVAPGDIMRQLPSSPPPSAEKFNDILRDLEKQIMPGITHWQHPNFHAYFPGNSSFPSILGEMITSAIGAQCMVWETSPAAAELEEVVMNWLKEIMDLPKAWHGVIQDTASTATLVALLTAREVKTQYAFNTKGATGKRLRVYCSQEIHSSIDKAVKIAGIGSENLVKVGVDENMALVPSILEKRIQEDLEAGFVPCAVVAGIGTTGTLAFDPLQTIAPLCNKYDLWLHVDAAYAGSAMVLPEQRHWIEGVDQADSFVFNPHKWLFTNFDCTAYFIKDREALIRTFEILPEYLKTKTRGQVNDYRDWGIQLGRRFRALKLWFVIRTFGVEGIRSKVREHIEFGAWLGQQIENHADYELLTPQRMNMVVFRTTKGEAHQLNDINEQILHSINASGEAYITHTKVGEAYALRVVLGQTYLQRRHVEKVWELICSHTQSIAG